MLSLPTKGRFHQELFAMLEVAVCRIVVLLKVTPSSFIHKTFLLGPRILSWPPRHTALTLLHFTRIDYTTFPISFTTDLYEGRTDLTTSPPHLPRMP